MPEPAGRTTVFWSVLSHAAAIARIGGGHRRYSVLRHVLGGLAELAVVFRVVSSW
jgi:hypothetical protein